MARVYDMTAGMFHTDASRGQPDDQQPDGPAPLVPESPQPALQEFVPEPPADTAAIHHIRELLKRG